MSKKYAIEAAILAGGQSRRMGEDKAVLRVGRRTLLGHARALAAEMGLNCRVVRVDCRAGNGPLGGIETALRRTKAERVLFLSCDMPFLSASLAGRIMEVKHPAVFAAVDGLAGFPFCLSREMLPSIEARLETRELSLQSLARNHGRHWRVPKRDWPQLANINTPEELAAARAALQS